MFTLITFTAVMCFFFYVWAGVNRSWRDSGESGMASISAVIELTAIAIFALSYIPTAQFILTL